MRWTSPSRSADRDPVADLDRPFSEQDQSGNEVADDRLQAKADADRKGAGEKGDLAEAETKEGHGHQDGGPGADIGHRRRERGAHAQIHPRLRQVASLEPSADFPRHQQAGEEEGERAQDGAGRNHHLAEVQDEIGRGHPADDVVRAGAERRQQGRGAEKQQGDTREAREQDSELLQHLGRRSERGAGQSAKCGGRRQQRREQIIEETAEQQQAGEHGSNPDHLMGKKSGHGEISGQQSRQGGREGRPGGHGNDHPGSGDRSLRRRLARAQPFGAGPTQVRQGDADHKDLHEHRHTIGGQ